MRKASRIIATVPDDMYEALESEALAQRVPIADIVRRAVGEYFARRGVTVEDRVIYGNPNPRGTQTGD